MKSEGGIKRWEVRLERDGTRLAQGAYIFMERKGTNGDR